ncbi:thiamine pyrophosphate-dependent enzyme [Natronosalvus halobius]|uniref:thiamine pyrophosphate-dependent enzyme n=1 Tax=Natronosalvus halobius TaxID=2953746 RepID=UPI00209EC2A0|nr:thiamine pyrophosphate-dependent enzyme [Natronosalvus halobius]USZ73634.1 thiamine pyrophosphate-dependent enzyme [Natronosalvus halobius]
MSQLDDQSLELGAPSGSIAECTLSEPEKTPQRYRIVDDEGNYDPDALPPLSNEELKELYRWMVLQQVIDVRMVKLQRRGEMGTYASGRGQEASMAGCAYALEDQDWLFPYGREATALLIQGMPLRDLLLYWRGVEDANKQRKNKVFPPAIAIGTHIPVGVGFSWGMSLDNSDAITTLYHGDGHPSTGEYQAGMNFASVIDAPALFYCQNNGYSISASFEQQTGAKTVAQKGIAYGLDGIRVDGNDILAVYDAVRTAREHVSKGNPTIVESVSYRLDAHTTNDDPSLYRDDEEVAQWEEKEPVSRFESFLKEFGLWDDIDEEAVREEANEQFDQAKEAADAYDSGGVEEMFKYLYDEMPAELERQLEAFEQFLEERPDAYDHIEHRPKG